MCCLVPKHMTGPSLSTPRVSPLSQIYYPHKNRTSTRVQALLVLYGRYRNKVPLLVPLTFLFHSQPSDRSLPCQPWISKLCSHHVETARTYDPFQTNMCCCFVFPINSCIRLRRILHQGSWTQTTFFLFSVSGFFGQAAARNREPTSFNTPYWYMPPSKNPS